MLRDYTFWDISYTCCGEFSRRTCSTRRSHSCTACAGKDRAQPLGFCGRASPCNSLRFPPCQETLLPCGPLSALKATTLTLTLSCPSPMPLWYALFRTSQIIVFVQKQKVNNDSKTNATLVRFVSDIEIFVFFCSKPKANIARLWCARELYIIMYCRSARLVPFDRGYRW